MSVGINVAFVAQRPSDLLAVGHRATKVRWLASCEGGEPAHAVAKRLHVDLISAEDDVAHRRIYSAESASELAARFDGHPAGLRIVGYAQDEAMRRRAARIGHVVVPRSETLRKEANDKAAGRALLHAIGVPTVAGTLINDARDEVGRLFAKYGSPLVVQRLHGSAGRFTWLVSKDDDVPADHGSDPLLVSPLHDGCTLNLHILVMEGDVSVSAPSVQVNGCQALSDNPFSYCGGDFSAASRVPADACAVAADMGRRVGWAFGNRGWWGFLGLDVQVSCDGVRALEINPRLQASSWVLTELEAIAGSSTHGARHFDMACGADPRSPFKPPAAADGAFLVMRKRRLDPVPGQMHRVGIYALAGTSLRFMRPGVGLRALGPSEVYIEGFPPVPDADIEHDASIARVAAREQLIECDGRTPTLMGGQLITALREMLSRPAGTDQSWC